MQSNSSILLWTEQAETVIVRWSRMSSKFPHLGDRGEPALSRPNLYVANY